MDEENKKEELNKNSQEQNSIQENEEKKDINIEEQNIVEKNIPEENVVDNDGQTTNNQNTVNNPSQPQCNNNANTQNINNTKQNKSKAPIVIIIVLIVVLLLGCIVFSVLGIVGFAIYKNTSMQTVKPTTSYNNSYYNSYKNTSNTVKNNKTNTSNNNTTNNTTNNTANNTTNNNTTNSKMRSDAKKSTKESPLNVGDWGIASKYSTKSSNYDEVAVKITKVTRGEDATKQVKEFTDKSSSYKYEEPKTNMEWVVIEYEVDLSTYNKANIGANADVTSKVEGTDSSSIKYNDVMYIATTTYIGSRDYVKTDSVTGKIATQIPVGCKDYVIELGSYGKTIAYFKGE